MNMSRDQCSYGARDGCMCNACDPDAGGLVKAASMMARERAELDAMAIGNGIDRFLHEILPARIAMRRRAEAVYQDLTRRGFMLYVEHGSLRIEPANKLDRDEAAALLAMPFCGFLEGVTDDNQAD